MVLTPGCSASWHDPGFWRGLVPGLALTSESLRRERSGWQPGDLDSFRTKLRREGYLHQPPIGWPVDIAALAEGVRSLSEADIPPVFCYVYDGYWDLFAHLAPMLGAVLGPDYRTIPNLWAWHIDPKASAAGWAPHRDLGQWSLLPDGAPKSLSLWVPLTDATPLNGCMYLVPADRDPTYNTPRENDVAVNLQDVRALPAAAGSVLGWNQALLHWGSHAADCDAPARISVSFEFQRGDVQAINVPLLEPDERPDFETRLRIISKAVLHYCERQPLEVEPVVFALRIVRDWPLWMMSPEAAKWQQRVPV